MELVSALVTDANTHVQEHVKTLVKVVGILALARARMDVHECLDNGFDTLFGLNCDSSMRLKNMNRRGRLQNRIALFYIFLNYLIDQ